MTVREKLEEIISKYYSDGYVIVEELVNDPSSFILVLDGTHTVRLSIYSFGIGVSIAELYSCENITVKIGVLLQHLYDINNELTNFCEEEQC